MAILSVRNLTKKYDEKSGVFNFNLSVEKNDVVLLLGPNGAGKTTAFKGILGLIPVDKDEITILGTDISKREEVMQHVGAMISKPAFYDYLTGYEHLKLWGLVYKQVDANRVEGMFSKIGLEPAKNKLVGAYSSGMKQRLDLARAIIHEPDLLILDEPFNGMDIESKHDLKKVLKSKLNEGNLGIIISSHMTGDLESMANKVIIIYEGRTLFNGLMTEIIASSLSLEEFYLEKLSLYKSKEVS
jgi:ABC-2 type transport system ATP-binding protein